MPHEENLTPPSLPTKESSWSVVAKNSRVNRDWKKLIERHPESACKCYEFLQSTPTQRSPGQIFPLKGKIYKGAWEYKVSKGDRVFYTLDTSNQKVVVYYAGKHPKSRNPTP